MKSRIAKLYLVYNADSGSWNALVDIAKKMLMVQGCALCSITHGMFGEKSEWQSCKAEFGVPIEVVHRNDVQGTSLEAFSNSLPCVVAEIESGEKVLLLGPDVLQRCRGNVADFRGKLKKAAF